MSSRDRVVYPTATPEQRVEAIQSALDARGMNASEGAEELDRMAQEQWAPGGTAPVS
jgi:hypothetical protein